MSFHRETLKEQVELKNKIIDYENRRVSHFSNFTSDCKFIKKIQLKDTILNHLLISMKRSIELVKGLLYCDW